MAIFDRDYYRNDTKGGLHVLYSSTVKALLCVLVVVFVLQNIASGPRGSGGLTAWLACGPQHLFHGFPQVWRLFTACFAHSTDTLWHLFGNMIGIYFFGRYVERLYDRRDFLILFLASGSFGILCETIAMGISGETGFVLGASGAVFALIVVLATTFPHERVHLLIVPVSIPLWTIAAAFVALQALGIFANDHTANFAHLGGAAFGFLYRRLDWRWSRIRGAWPGRILEGRQQTRRRVERAPSPNRSTPPEPDAVSLRIDEILAKISSEGMGSLSEEEREFLLANSKRYRSPR